MSLDLFSSDIANGDAYAARVSGAELPPSSDFTALIVLAAIVAGAVLLSRWGRRRPYGMYDWRAIWRRLLIRMR